MGDEEKPATEKITEELFRQAYQYEEIKKPTPIEKIKRELKCTTDTIFNLFPILKWLPKYQIKRDLIGDIVAGITVSIMHIPHGLAYGPLAGQEPVVGLYMAVFPTIIYMMMGTSRHVSLGTFAVLTMMTGQIVFKYATVHPHTRHHNGARLNMTVLESTEKIDEGYTHLDVGITVCFTVGLCQLLLGIFRLGVLSVLLSNSLVSGFTAGAAVHVATFQIKNLLGIEMGAYPGPLKLLWSYVDIFKDIKNTNFVTMGISIFAIVILYTFNEYGKPYIEKKFPKCKIPIPMELLIIISGILISYFLNLNQDYDVDIVAHVPTGLPDPSLPKFELIPAILIDCMVIAIVAISINFSLAKMFAKKGGYSITDNQELLAYGLSNMFGAFFQCVPVAASLSRSIVQYSVGGKTILANVFCILLITLILLFMGPFFEPVPFAVLSSIVIVTLKKLLIQVTDFPDLWRKSKLDGMVWLITFCSIVLIDLDYGLCIGIIASITVIIIRSQNVQIVVLGRVPETNIYLDVKHFKKAVKVPKILILQIIGGVQFSNVQKVQNDVTEEFLNFESDYVNRNTLYVVLNMVSVTYLDPAAVSGLLSLYNDFKKYDCNLLLTDCNLYTYEVLQHCEFFEKFPKDQVLPTVADAVEFLNKKI